MAAYAALVSLLNNIHAINNHPSLSTSLDDLPIQPLLEKTNCLLDFIGGNNYGGGSKEAQDMERKITIAAHAAEDLIETRIVDQIHADEGLIESELEEESHAGEGCQISDRSENSLDRIQAAADPIDAAEEGGASLTWSYLLTFLLKCVGCHLSDRSEKTVNLQRINADMDAIMQEAKQLKVANRLGLGEEQIPTHPESSLTDRGESAMVGLDAELNQLLDELTGYHSSRRIISIDGMGGAGKTTLAKNVYQNSLIKEKFQFRAWTTISQQNNPKEVLSELLSGLGEFSSGTMDDLGLQLHQTLSCRRYLIVLDDIWSVTAWDEVKRFFPDSNNGSRILITTRLSNVAEDCGSSGSSLFKMNLLDWESSWKLFCEKAFQGEECPPELREVGEEIVALCEGLALSIVVIGGILLKSPRILGYWKAVAKDLKSIPNSKEKQQSLDVLSLSYNHLPPHLKPCFLYMGVFREDSQIHVSKIIKLWIAEGFIKSMESQVLEEIAEGYVNDLIDRNLVLVGRRRKNGKVGYCGIHDLLRDLCITLAEQQELFRWSEGKIRGTQRRLIYNTRKRGTTLRLPLIRSITASDINGITECRLLRVVDEHGRDRLYPSRDYLNPYCDLLHTNRDHLHPNYYRNVNLRYLAYNCLEECPWKLPISVSCLRYRRTLKLPTSVSCIWNLQTLIIDHLFPKVIMVLPIEFWKMRQLRHVNCRCIYIPGPPPSNGQEGLLILENLQTLKLVINLRLSEEVCKIISNIKILDLIYDIFQQDSLAVSLCNLDRLHKLESLRIYSGCWRNLVADRKKLTISFPRSLKKLSLFGCKLHWDDMAIIGLLPILEVLHLDDDSVCEGAQWSPVDGQFCQLKYLKIQKCKLKCWEAEASHFPVLEKLILRCFYDLEEIPLSIGDIPTLQLIDVYDCSVSAAISAVKIKEDQLDNGVQLQVEVTFRK